MRARGAGAARCLALALCAALSGCYASNVVAPEERDVVVAAPKLDWHPAKPEDIPGFYASTKVEGESAGALLKAYYQFGPLQDGGGDYSGAALVVTPQGPRFVVIAEDGKYRFDPESGLDLQDGGPPAKLEAAEGHLRLSDGASTITFERVELQ
ncbi:MAG: hypothetical protein AB7N76_37170 [Planctomycetota bacterium]